MSEETLIIDTAADGRATVTLNRPDVHNAFDDHLIQLLTRELETLDRDPSVRVVVLAAAGKSFSAGADLNWIKRTADYSEAENLADAKALAGLMKTLSGLSKPSVAAVQGAAYGGGVGLIACSDIAIASETAVFSLSEVRLGLIGAVISPYVIAAIGERQAHRYMLSAERFDAREALGMGLVHQVTAAEGLKAGVDHMVETLLANGPEAMAETKKLIAAVAGRPRDDTLIAHTAARIARVRGSKEGREGVAAFLEKRKPGWIKE
ncbi:MAG: enoyl-CoA hydratase/isomerase family protein [Proteobacteria bacterium]|nr:enoyl-CoA hydratase/isomerase family protein [Pseudomonadota bacterium]MCH8237048.1 enoyl-CoA hydratase/isomerase family protein [Pseudomonadota bacterium]